MCAKPAFKTWGVLSVRIISQPCRLDSLMGDRDHKPCSRSRSLIQNFINTKLMVVVCFKKLIEDLIGIGSVIIRNQDVVNMF